MEERATARNFVTLPRMDAAARTLRVFIDENGLLGRDPFLKKFAHPFLLTTVYLEPDAWERTIVFDVRKRQGAVHGPGVVIGRSHDADIVIPRLSVSKHHARFQQDGAAWTITDLGSRNGTGIDGKALAPNRPEPLRDLVALELGPDSRLYFVTSATLFELISKIASITKEQLRRTSRLAKPPQSPVPPPVADERVRSTDGGRRLARDARLAQALAQIESMGALITRLEVDLSQKDLWFHLDPSKEGAAACRERLGKMAKDVKAIRAVVTLDGGAKTIDLFSDGK